MKIAILLTTFLSHVHKGGLDPNLLFSMYEEEILNISSVYLYFLL